MIKLDNVTFLAVNGSADADMFLHALNYSMRGVKPKKSVLVSWKEPSISYENIDFYKINKIPNHKEYSRFLIENICNYFETDYMIMIQDDGYILNPHLWTDEFLQYDYIGAPWPKQFFGRSDNLFQGNGGFSLRSKKIVEKVKKFVVKWEDVAKPPEDVFTCLTMRPMLESQGFKWAPLDIARRFSTEWPIPELGSTDGSDSFGFHCSGDFPSKKNLNLAKQYYFRNIKKEIEGN